MGVCVKAERVTRLQSRGFPIHSNFIDLSHPLLTFPSLVFHVLPCEINFPEEKAMALRLRAQQMDDSSG